MGIQLATILEKSNLNINIGYRLKSRETCPFFGLRLQKGCDRSSPCRYVDYGNTSHIRVKLFESLTIQFIVWLLPGEAGKAALGFHGQNKVDDTMDNIIDNEKLVRQYIEQGNREAAIKLLFELAVRYAKGKISKLRKP